MPRASAADAAATARAVLEHATSLFAERGVAEVSLDDVAQAAGVTRGAVYHHYGNRAGLFAAVAARLQEGVAEAVVAAAGAAGPDARAQLRAGSHAFLDAVTSGEAARILLVDAPAALGWGEWRRLDAENSASHLREALAAVGVDPELLDALTAQLSGAMNEAALQVGATDAGAPRTAALAAAHRALDRVLGAVVG